MVLYYEFPCSPPRPGGVDPPGWQPVCKRRRISRFPLASGPAAARSPGRANSRGARWNSPRSAPAARTGGPWASRRRPRRSAPQRTPGHRRARVRPDPARRGWNPAQTNPGPTRNGCPHGRAPKVTPERLSRCPSRFARRSAATPRVSPTGDARGDMTAADHIEAVRLTLPVHGRSQARSISWHGRGRAERCCTRSLPLWRQFRPVGVGACAAPTGLICALAQAA
jgi:hypothetical protein